VCRLPIGAQVTNLPYRAGSKSMRHWSRAPTPHFERWTQQYRDLQSTQAPRSLVIVRGMKVAALWLAAVSLSAQSFEVASVKPNHNGAPPRTYPRLHNGGFTADNASLKTLLVIAYGLIEQRIFGPEWLDTEKYDITAKAPAGTADDQVMPLLQGLLKDRFQLQSHMETREMAAYDMVVAKSGAKLTPFDPAHPSGKAPGQPRFAGGSMLVGVGTGAQIADALARAAGRPVIDRTGLEGRFAWSVSYTPFSSDANAAANGPPDILAAVQDQLGLRLEPKKESLQVLVIDHAERVPSEN
jgi:uncharacterized protein (TIGR03435 family)